MTAIQEVVHRSKHGPAMSEEDFDLTRLVPKAREVVKKYGIKYDPDTPVPFDDEMADAVYQAALDFFVDVGCYVKKNGRVVEFSRDEVEEAIAALPGEVWFGEGRDARLAKHRVVEDPARPLLWAAVSTWRVTEELYYPMGEAFLSSPLCDITAGAFLAQIDDVEIGVGDATEYFGATRIAEMGLELRRRVGRPGMAIMNQTPCGVEAIGMLAAARQLSPHDGYFVAPVSEMRLDPDRLIKAAYLQDWQANSGLLFAPIFGGMAGGPETTAVIMTAYWMLGAASVKCNYFIPFTLHMMGVNNTHRPVMWAVNLSGQAIARNTRAISFDHIFTRHGAGTDLCIYECVAALMGIMASGYHPAFIGFAGGGKLDVGNPLDTQLIAEVALATVGISREEANELCLKFLVCYEDKLFPDQDLGKTFPEVYDIERREPKPEAVAHYQRMKQTVADMGIRF